MKECFGWVVVCGGIFSLCEGGWTMFIGEQGWIKVCSGWLGVS